MLALFRRFFAAPDPGTALPTYIALVERARKPFFYETLGVPDTLDGRFELIVLHLFLLQHRLRAEAPATEDFARRLAELFFADMDRSVRELGVADTGVRYRIKAMAKAYHGRLQAYTASLEDTEALRTALARNLYGTVTEGDVQMLVQAADYVRDTAAALQAVPIEALTSGMLQWPAIPMTPPLRAHG